MMDHSAPMTVTQCIVEKKRSEMSPNDQLDVTTGVIIRR